MEDLGCESNKWFPWSNIMNHHQEMEAESFIFGSENNIFFNPIQELRRSNSSVCLNPTTAATSRQIGAPARMDSINSASSFGAAASQHWSKTLTGNIDFQESLGSLLSATNSNADTSSDHDDGISVIFPDYKNLCNKIVNGVSSGDSVTKDIDDGSNNSRFYEDNQPRSKKSRSDPDKSTSSTINFRQGNTESDETDSEAIAQMKEMIYRAAAFRPVSFADEEVAEKRRRRNVRISSDPQTVAARQRREKISDKIRVLQKLVPGGNKMDTASMLDEAANYLKFLRSQVKALEQFGQKIDYVSCGTTTDANSTSQMIQNIDPTNFTRGVPFPMQTPFLLPHQQLYPAPPPA